MDSYIKKGDCLELMKEIPDKSIDMILCDLPYGTSACKWDTIIPFDALWVCYKRIIKDDGAIVLFGSEPFSSTCRMSNLKMYKYDWKWEKPNGANFMNFKFQPAKVHEDIMVFGSKATSYSKKGNLNYYPQMTEGLAYTQKSGKHKKEFIGKNWQEMPKSIIKAFYYLWNSTIKKAELNQYGWDANPYVFVYEFEVISKEEAMKEVKK